MLVNGKIEEWAQNMRHNPWGAIVEGMTHNGHHVTTPGPVAFGGYFFGITGFHGFHVFSGVIINIIMLVMAQKGVFNRKGHYLMIEKAGLYWHFVTWAMHSFHSTLFKINSERNEYGTASGNQRKYLFTMDTMLVEQKRYGGPFGSC